MVIDSSAVIAVLSNEPDARNFAVAIEAALTRLISAASLLEAAIVIEARYGLAGGSKLDELVNTAQINVEPVTLEQIAIARLAFRTYGKGRHPASLNFGDCFAYALAKFSGEPLLFKDNDFNQTDIQVVII